MPLPPSSPVELLPDPDRAGVGLAARTHDPRLTAALAAILADDVEHPFDAFVSSAVRRLARPGADLSEAVAAIGVSPSDPGVAPFVSRVVSAGQRLDRLTARLAEYADACTDVVDPGDVEPAVAVEAALGDLVALGQPTPADVEVTGPALAFDPALLRLAMRHLLGNAALYAAGPVSIVTRRDHDGCEVGVSDHGPGIPAADRRRVLQPLVRLDRDRATPGDGLGLAICSRVTQAHQGMIFVNRAEGGGSTVRLVRSLR